jgi:phosphate starvation-inducible PhoH-like protein
MIVDAPKKTKRATRYKNASTEAKARVIALQPMNENQHRYMEAIHSHDQVIVMGPSGTGKTFVAATLFANMYANKEIDKIIITRPNVSVGRELGFLPGDLNEKFTPWAVPVLEVLQQQLGKGVVETAIKNGNIEMAPLSTMRGRSFKNAAIICDESQNLTIAEVKMFLSRIGENCKVILNGDIHQSDIKEQSGLSKIIHMAKKYSIDAVVIEFQLSDIVRSSICKQWIVAFMEENL